MGPSRRLAIVVVTLVVLQFLVPAVALVLPDKPNRLGWQMYSGMGQDDVIVVDQNGSAVEVPWEDFLAWPRRIELDWTNHLPELLCERVDAETLSVTVGRAERTVTC